MRTLAIFDLDHTLITCDSDANWPVFLERKGIVGKDFMLRGQRFYADYERGELNVDEFLASQLEPLSRFTMEELAALHKEYMEEVILPHVTEDAKKLVERHRNPDTTLLVLSATNEFIITPIAKVFGIENVVGTKLEIDANGRYTGRHVGIPSYKEGKIKRLDEWLGTRGEKRSDYDVIHFYSDSKNDLPLLRLVDVPHAVNPDGTLFREASEKGWEIITFPG